VADFYNRIIGHYEVPLDNPGRDRERGRIWRIVYRGTNNASAKAIQTPQHYDISKDSVSALIKDLGNENLTIRMLAMNELTDRIGEPAIKPVQKMLENKKSSAWQRIHGMWVLYRADALDSKTLEAAAMDPDYRLRVHAMRIYAETESWDGAQHELVIAALHDTNALVVRCAADALGLHPRIKNIRPLLDAREATPAEDTHRLHVIRMALRNQLRDTNIFGKLPLPTWSDADERAIADVAQAVPSAESATFLLRHLRKYDEPADIAAAYLRHVTRYFPASQMDELVELTRKKFTDNLDLQLTLFKSVQEGTAQRGVTTTINLQAWGAELATHLAETIGKEGRNWHNTPIENSKDPANPWSMEERPSGDGKNNIPFISSRVVSESRTGVLRSREFDAPDKLGFWMAGHNGIPDKPDQKKNFIRLRASDTGEILAESFPPRHDTAKHFEWDLKTAAGRKVYLEITDGDDAGAYAWLAVGRFDPQVVPMPALDPHLLNERKVAVADIARTFKLAELEPQMADWLADRDSDTDAREAAALALAAINPDAHVEVMSGIAQDASESSSLREKMANALARANTDAARTALIKSLQTAPDRLQVKMALLLASTKEGAEILLREAEQGQVSRRLLLERLLTERFSAVKPEDYEKRVAVLTKGLPPADEARQKILDQRRKDFDPAKANATLGAAVFAKNCSVCHSMDNKGGAVGPHLDGVGNRGLERLIEDVLDPSRNVDPSFRFSTLQLKNGDVYAGLFRREEGETLVFVDATGKETAIPKTDIVQRVESTSSLMPDGFSEAIPLADFNNLMAFLLSKGGGAQAKK
jgi:putative heme-binding domain-containing protein